MRETLRGALLSALCFAGMTLFAAVPAAAQGGGGTMECGEENGRVECDDEIDVTAPEPDPDPPQPDPPKQPPREPDPPPPPENTCLTCHPNPHDPQDDEEEEEEEPKRPDCSMAFIAVNAASELEDRERTFFPVNTMHTQECAEARMVYLEAMSALTKCLTGR